MTQRSSRSKSVPAFGLYRRRPQGQGEKKRNVGAYIIDIRIKDVPEFAGIKKRIVRSTEVFPGDRDAERRVREMKAMVKELIRERNDEILRRIQNKSLSLASAYRNWKTGRLSLAYGFEGEKLLKLWRAHYEKSPFSAATKKSRKAALDALVSHGLLTEQHVVNDLPLVLKNVRDHYQRTKQHHQYNTVRTEAMAFAKRKIGVDEGSPFFQALRTQRRLRLVTRREHHPFDTPRDFRVFLDALHNRKTIPAASRWAYKQAALFMCLHGLRPDEFASQQVETDSHTKHLRIKGSKNANANRVAPMLMKLDNDIAIPASHTLNKTFEHMGLPCRCRDFRRTYAIWCEKAIIPHNRLRIYMGHEAVTLTHLYQRLKPTRQMLDEDCAALKAYFEREFFAPAREEQTEQPASASLMLLRLAPRNLSELLRQIRQDTETVGPEGQGDVDEDPTI